MTLRPFIAALALTAVVTTGGAAPAFAGRGPVTPDKPAAMTQRSESKPASSTEAPRPDRAERQCRKATKALAKAERHHARLQAQLDRATAKQQEMAAAGNTEAADRFAAKVARLQERLTKSAERIAELQAKVAERCPAPAAG